MNNILSILKKNPGIELRITYEPEEDIFVMKMIRDKEGFKSCIPSEKHNEHQTLGLLTDMTNKLN